MDRDKKRIILRLVLVLFCSMVFLIVATGCLQDFVPRLLSEGENEGPQEAEREEPEREEPQGEEIPAGVLSYQVYYVEGKNRYLLPVTMLKPWTEGVARSALEKLIEGPAPAIEMGLGLSSPLPPHTQIRGINIRDGLCRVDFNSDFLEYDPGTEREVLGSIIYTLLQFETVREVEIVVEGSTIETFPGGTPGRETFDRHYNLNLEVAGELDELKNAEQYRLYFCALLGENHIFYIPVTRVLAGEKEQLEVAVNELLHGPREGTGLFSDIPAGTELLNFSLQGGELVVNFSRELLNYEGGRLGEENIKNQLLLTLTELPGVETVQILIEGEKKELPYGTSFQEPLAPPLLINQLHQP